MNKLQIGAKVSYRDFDKAGKEKWKAGIIHGLTKVDTKSGPKVLAYVVDTGKDDRVDEYNYDVRGAEINKRVNAALDKKGLEGDERLLALPKTVEDVAAQKDLPKSKIVNETVRQPELVYVEPKDIKASE